MWRTLVVFLLLLVLSIVPAEATTFGTEADPELVDAEGNVQYHPAYSGAKDRGHVDILAAWYEYVPSNETLLFSWKFSSFENLFARTRGWQLVYTFNARIVGGDNHTTLSHDIIKEETKDEFRHRTDVSRPGLVSGDLRAGFSANLTQPGYLRIWIPLAKLNRWGFAISALNASAGELQFLTPVNAISNSNSATSAKTFEFGNLNATRQQDSSDEPDASETGPAIPSASDGGSKSPGLGLGVAIAWAGAAFCWRLRRK